MEVMHLQSLEGIFNSGRGEISYPHTITDTCSAVADANRRLRHSQKVQNFYNAILGQYFGQFCTFYFSTFLPAYYNDNVFLKLKEIKWGQHRLECR
jgi:tryptophan synthase beta subunit